MNLEGLELGKIISCEANLNVREGRYKNDNVMIKEYNISEMSLEEKKRLRNELKILEIINSRYLVHHYANLMLENKLLIVLEYFPGKTLREYINLFQSRNRHFNEKTICRALFNLSSALKYLHEEREYGRLVHRSINPDTIMLTSDGEFVLGDLGLTKFSNSMLSTLTNDPSYRAPEMFKDNNNYTYKVDIWSIGCILYEMCSLKPLFNNFDTLQMSRSKSINDNNKIERIPWRYSNDLWNIIKKCLILDVNKRCDVDYILQTEYVKNYINENEVLPRQVESLIEQKPQLSFDRYPLVTETIIPSIYKKEQQQKQLISSFSSTEQQLQQGDISSLSSSSSSSSSSNLSYRLLNGSNLQPPILLTQQQQQQQQQQQYEFDDKKKLLSNQIYNNNNSQYKLPILPSNNNDYNDDDEYTSFIDTQQLKSVEIKALIDRELSNKEKNIIIKIVLCGLLILILCQLWFHYTHFCIMASILLLCGGFYTHHYKENPKIFSCLFWIVWKTLAFSFWVVYYSLCCCCCSFKCTKWLK